MTPDSTSPLQAYFWAARRLRQAPTQLHCVGVGGVGMAGLALLLLRKGWKVSGCDAEEGPLLDWLRAQGAAVSVGHAGEHLEGLAAVRGDLVVRSPAVPAAHPELAAARAAGLTVLDRGVMLAALLDALPQTVAVCGAHGKTTTATFTATLLRALGRPAHWCIGGTSEALGAPAAFDPAQAPLVAECDESDGTLALYHPLVTVLTGIDNDHLDHFGDMAALEAVFARVVRQTRGPVVYVREDERSHALAGSLPGSLAVGLHPEAALGAGNIEPGSDATEFDLLWQGRSLGRYRLGVPGLHNLRNALAALGAVRALGVDLVPAAGALAGSLRLPGRRFECVAEGQGIRVLSDYAHHPAEISALVAAARLQPRRRLLAVFQPHRYSRTLTFGERFPEAFAGVTALALAPVYAASETPLPGGASADLYVRFRGAAAANPAIPVPVLAGSLDGAWHWLRHTVRAGDLVLLVGAGSIVRLAERIRAADGAWTLPPCAMPPVEGLVFESPAATAGRVSFGAGGEALGWAKVSTPEALRKVLEVCAARGLPWKAVGCGTNLLVADTGYPGIFVQLEGSAFRECMADPARPGMVRVGAGWSGPALLDRLQELGLGGLECMEGIPGTLGGWLAMNAGVPDGTIGERVDEVCACDAAGSEWRRDGSGLGFGYRRCEALRGAFALSATLCLLPAAPDAIAQRRKAFRARRTVPSEGRSAGSVFRNPPGESAGRLLDRAGCKGLRVGGAEISPRHANVIVAHPGVTASDILALAERAARRVTVPLEYELCILE